MIYRIGTNLVTILRLKKKKKKKEPRQNRKSHRQKTRIQEEASVTFCLQNQANRNTAKILSREGRRQ